ncbi:MAG: hypothetical protein F4X03_09235 [Dehalococcoidia bacterium]|nr:hypothetical protein [Dehalococcoidia bacterium]MYD29075.1 hypothetical protein [Dehalococcoidia bacterium]
MPYMSAIATLASLSDAERLKAISEGVNHLAANVERLDQAAHSLADAGDPTTATLLGNFASEEAAKILLLVDVVRCPPEQSSLRGTVLKLYYDHLWKGIYVCACEWRPATFEEFRDYVRAECEPYYLDGPASVDWVFPNEILATRESLVYVDYLQDITGLPKERAPNWWHAPSEVSQYYVTSRCIEVALALFRSGLGTPLGLEVVADVWRDFDPVEGTTSDELHSTVLATLEAMSDRAGFPEGRPSEEDMMAMLQWPFPLWGLVDARKEYDRKRSENYIDRLREARGQQLKEVFEVESRRDPQPAIPEEKVLALHRAHLAVEADLQARVKQYLEGRGEDVGLRIIPASLAVDEASDSYHELRRQWRRLTEDERIALIALAWFARGEIADWGRAYEGAVERSGGLGERYQLGLRRDWLKGWRRWQSEPKPRLGGEVNWAEMT